MYLRTIGRRNKDGSEVRYVQLAHNEWDPERKCSIAKVIYSFGREDQLDRAALARLVGSLSRVLEPEQALIATAPTELEFVGSVPAGGAWAVDGLWRRLGIDTAIERLLAERRLDARAERLVFAMVANRALAPFSKLACCEWLAADVAISGSPAVPVGRVRRPNGRHTASRRIRCSTGACSRPTRGHRPSGQREVPAIRQVAHAQP
jgi:hypothetical protein